jgi:hypothetical protein
LQQHLPPLLWVGGAAGQAIYIKTYLKAKEELWKLKYFTMQKYNLQEILLKETKKSFKILQLYN